MDGVSSLTCKDELLQDASLGDPIANQNRSFLIPSAEEGVQEQTGLISLKAFGPTVGAATLWLRNFLYCASPSLCSLWSQPQLVVVLIELSAQIRLEGSHRGFILALIAYARHIGTETSADDSNYQ